jgi:hypothetical protein
MSYLSRHVGLNCSLSQLPNQRFEAYSEVKLRIDGMMVRLNSVELENDRLKRRVELLRKGRDDERRLREELEKKLEKQETGYRNIYDDQKHSTLPL